MTAKKAITKVTAEKVARKTKDLIDELDNSLANVAKSGAASDVAVAAIQGLAATNAQAAIAELLTKILTGDITVTQTTENLAAGILSQTVIKKNNVAIATVNIPKDYVNNILGLVTITAGTGADAGKFFDGVTEVGQAQGVTSAGVYMKSKEAAHADGSEAAYKYANVSGLIEYVTSGSQTGDMFIVNVDPTTHKVTVTATDGTITKSKLHSSVQTSLDKADTALQEADIVDATDEEVAAWFGDVLENEPE